MTSDNTDLRTFVSEALTQIISGVSDAQKKANELDASVNPTLTQPRPEVLVGRVPNGRYAYMAEFDIAVTVGSESSADGSGKIRVAGFQISGGKAAGEATQAVSRVTFCVPLVFPVDPMTEEARTAERREGEKRAKEAAENMREAQRQEHL